MSRMPRRSRCDMGACWIRDVTLGYSKSLGGPKEAWNASGVNRSWRKGIYLSAHNCIAMELQCSNSRQWPEHAELRMGRTCLTTGEILVCATKSLVITHVLHEVHGPHSGLVCSSMLRQKKCLGHAGGSARQSPSLGRLRSPRTLGPHEMSLAV